MERGCKCWPVVPTRATLGVLRRCIRERETHAKIMKARNGPWSQMEAEAADLRALYDWLDGVLPPEPPVAA